MESWRKLVEPKSVKEIKKRKDDDRKKSRV